MKLSHILNLKPFGHQQRRLYYLLGLALAVGLLALPRPVHVVVSGLDHPASFWTFKSDLAVALGANGIQIGPDERVEPPLTTPLRGQKELNVRVQQGVRLNVVVSGKQQEVLTFGSTVRDVLRELSLELGDQDRVSPGLDNSVAPGLELKVVRRTQRTRVRHVEIPFDTIRREDRTLSVGTLEEIQAGVPGTEEIKESVIEEDGREISVTLLEGAVSRPPVDRLVAYGTAGVVSRGGREYRFQKELAMTATGYTAGKESNPNGTGHTYTGIRAVRGVVAVDPNVIPLHTRLYVDGYGPALAADIGGAIKGNRIDLCFETVDEALTWGVRPVRVYLLGD